MEIMRGQVLSYDSTNHKADVMLSGSMSGIVLGVPVAYQVTPGQMAADMDCGVVFFGESDDGLVICTFGEVPVEPLNLDEYGPTLEILNLTASWVDHFLGDSLAPQYTSQIVGSGGIISLLDGYQSGVVRLRAGNANGRYVRLWLGDSAGGFDSIRPDRGVVMIVRMKLVTVTNANMQFGVEDGVGGDLIRVGLRTPTGNDWRVWCDDGSVSNTASGVAADTDWHVHAVEIGEDLVKYWLDSELIVTHVTNVPNATFCTPFVWSYSREAAYKQVFVDNLLIGPRND